MIRMRVNVLGHDARDFFDHVFVDLLDVAPALGLGKLPPCLVLVGFKVCDVLR